MSMQGAGAAAGGGRGISHLLAAAAEGRAAGGTPQLRQGAAPPIPKNIVSLQNMLNNSVLGDDAMKKHFANVKALAKLIIEDCANSFDVDSDATGFEFGDDSIREIQRSMDEHSDILGLTPYTKNMFDSSIITSYEDAKNIEKYDEDRHKKTAFAIALVTAALSNPQNKRTKDFNHAIQSVCQWHQHPQTYAPKID